MANAGRVELDLVAVGKDQVSAMLRQVESQARQMATGMKEAGAATGDVGAKLDGLRGKASGVNKVREVFENLRSNAFFVVGAVTGFVDIAVTAVGAIADLVAGADQAAKAMAYWEKQQQETNDAIKKGWQALDKFKTSPMESALSDINVQLAKASQLMADLKDDEDERRKILGDVRRLREVQAAIESDIARDQERQADAWDRIERRMREASLINVPLISPFTGNADDLAIGRNFAGEPETPEQKAAREKRLADAIEKARGGRGGGRGPDTDALFKALIERQQKLASDATESVFGSSSGGGNISMAGTSSEGGSALARMATDAEKLRDALNGVAAATSALAGDKFPELFGALSEIQTITQQVTDGKMKLGEALAASGAAALANTAKAIGGIRAEAALRAAYEVGLGFATLANPIESAGHFTAAALLGAVAVGAGGGSGGVRASSGGGRESASSGGPTTVVYNFSTMVTDRQQVTTALRQSQRSSRGTGHESRAGV